MASGTSPVKFLQEYFTGINLGDPVNDLRVSPRGMNRKNE